MGGLPLGVSKNRFLIRLRLDKGSETQDQGSRVPVLIVVVVVVL